MPAISIVIPCRNEGANLPGLLDEVAAAMAGRDHEVLVVDDGSSDDTQAVMGARIAAAGDGRLRCLTHDRSAGQSAAIRTGMLAARSPIVVTMDGDGQNDPAYLPRLADALEAAGPGTALVAGQRLKRTDTPLKRLSSRFANGLRQAILKDDTRDSGCGLKAVRTEVFRRLPFFDGWHRYLPALVLREGHAIAHLDVVDRARRHGRSNYGIVDRGLRGILDLYGVWWLRRRCRRVPTATELAP
ncbi:glycosyltransferase family 2 protein [Aquibium sp. A9E412]|uniref:glycosyltransferase family 2 protein n=1 Tax=Aquibium sp. A9E412 TaxID=2976767 RepID=UPI0025AF91E9|nr:glycosyltransferase family 2 protein [Aquibium sp. A9E412]MDN2566588.1 glycosyltransferase family 2 protein [Aquibium sp. A9E412]